MNHTSGEPVSDPQSHIESPVRVFEHLGARPHLLRKRDHLSWPIAVLDRDSFHEADNRVEECGASLLVDIRCKWTLEDPEHERLTHHDSENDGLRAEAAQSVNFLLRLDELECF